MVSGIKKSLVFFTVTLSALATGVKASTIELADLSARIHRYEAMMLIEESETACDDFVDMPLLESVEKVEILIALKDDFALNKKQVSMLEKLAKQIDKIDQTAYLLPRSDNQPLNVVLEQEIFIQERLLRLSKEAQQLLSNFKGSLNQETRNKIERMGVTL